MRDEAELESLAGEFARIALHGADVQKIAEYYGVTLTKAQIEWIETQLDTLADSIV